MCVYVFCKKGALKNFAKFTGKHLCQSLFFDKVAGLRPATLLKMRFCHSCFFGEFCKIFQNAFLQNTSEQLLWKCICLFVDLLAGLNLI